MFVITAEVIQWVYMCIAFSFRWAELLSTFVWSQKNWNSNLLAVYVCGVEYFHFIYVPAAGHDHVPSWVWVAAGIFNFLAYTLGEF